MLESTPEVLVIRGAPGVGKSSACKRLRALIPDGAVIEVDTLRGMIAGVRWVDTPQHLVALDHARLLAATFLEKGYRPVVIVDTFSRGKLTAFAASLPWSYVIASLYAEPSILERRVLGRPEDQFRELDACQVLNEEARLNRYPHEHFIDTSDLEPAGVAEALARLLGKIS